MSARVPSGAFVKTRAASSGACYFGSESAGASFDGSCGGAPGLAVAGAGVVVGCGGLSDGPASVAGAGAGTSVAFDGSPPAAGSVSLPESVDVLTSALAVDVSFFFLLLRPFPFEILIGLVTFAGAHLGTYFSP